MYDNEQYFNDEFIWDFAPYGNLRNHGLFFTDGIWMDKTGLHQLCAISGWLRGLKSSGSEEADAFADKALADLKRAFAPYRQNMSKEDKALVDSYGQLWDEKDFDEAFALGANYYPKRLVRYSGDFSFGGFSVAWLELASPDYQGPRNVHKHATYAVTMHGGLIYHGPAGDETLTVKIGDDERLWSYHT